MCENKIQIFNYIHVRQNWIAYILYKLKYFVMIVMSE